MRQQRYVRYLIILLLVCGSVYAESISRDEIVGFDEDKDLSIVNNEFRKLHFRSNSIEDNVTANTVAISSIITVPVGVIAIWSGSEASIPSGWILCDGNNDTPDLRNMFVIGAGDTYAVDDTATATTHTHVQVSQTLGETISGASVTAAAGYVYESSGDLAIGTTGGATSIDIIKNTTVASTTGSGGNLPPYYALCYIMKT